MSNVTGLLDVDSIVQSLTFPKQQQLQKIAQEKALVQAKSASISNLLSAINELKDFNSTLKPESLFKDKEVKVSDSSILSAQVTDRAPNLRLKVKVTELSQEEIRVSSEGVYNLSASLSGSTFTLKYWTSDTNYLETLIDFSTGGTLEDLVEVINRAQNKVLASIYYDGQSYKLMLTEKNAGDSTKETKSGAVIEISEGTLPQELGSIDTLLQEARNAKLKIGSETGTEVSSATNTFKDIISGLTLTALNTSEEFITITIKDSYQKLNTSLTNFFSKVNGIIDLVNQLTAKGALFQGNSSITQIKIQLFQLTKPLQELGIVNINENGTYSLNNENLNSLVEEGNTESLKKGLFKVKVNLDKYLEGLVRTFKVYQNVQNNQITALDTKAQVLQKAITQEQEKLRLTFSQIEALMYENEQLRTRLESFIISISKAMNNKE